MEMTRYASSYSFVIATSEVMVTRPWADQVVSVTMIHLSRSALG